MLHIHTAAKPITAATGHGLERVGFGSTNQPEKRCTAIFDALLASSTKSAIYTADQGPFHGTSSTVDLLRRIHAPAYCDFLKDAYANWQHVQDPFWSDETRALVPNHYARTVPSSGDVPLYKHSGYYCGDYMTPLFESSYTSALTAAHVSRHAGYSAATIDGKGDIFYALVDSPGHHAKYDQYNGYCFFANAMVAAQTMIDESDGAVRFVSILDLDFHAGNGTANIVATNPNVKNVQAVSLHTSPANDYPSFDGYESENIPGLIHNICLAKGTTWEAYKSALAAALDQIERFAPDALVVAFGGDTYKDDPDASPLARFALDIDDYSHMSAAVRARFPALPIVVTQEGGYHMEHIGAITTSFFSGFFSTQ